LKGVIRSVEAMLAIMLLFISLSSFFRIEPEEDAPLARYHRIVEDTLSVYDDIYRFLIFNKPSKIDDFTRSILPNYVNFRAEVEYVQPLDYFLGENDTNVPLTFYVDYPVGTDADTIRVYDGRHSLPLQREFNWFRIQFFVENDATPRSGYDVTYELELPFKDTNADGLLEPADPRSIEVFFDGAVMPSTQTMTAFDDDSLTVAITFPADLAANELSSGYVYYMVGDSYEG